MPTIKLTVNGKAVSVDVEDRTLLVHLLRENLNLTGTHVGCDTSQCGACVVHIDGRAVKSCTVLAGQAAGSSVTTIEGIAKGDEENPAASMIRTLLQRGDAIYTVTVKDPKTGQMTVKKIVKEGPACLITTGVTELKGEQLGSRIPALEVPDDPNQQKEALKAFARSELQGPAPAPDPALIAMQRYLQLQAPIDVIVPYVDTLTERLSSRIDSRLLRHTAWLMALIKGIAILRSARRERDEETPRRARKTA